MKKFGKNKIALLLACASIFGGETQAMDTNKSQRHQTLAARGATDKNSNKGFANWAKNHKWQLAVGIGVPVVATASILAFLGVKYWGKKDNGGEPNKGKPIKNNNGNEPTENKDIPKKDIEDPEKIRERKEVKECNEKIINDAIDEAKKSSVMNGYEFDPTLKNEEDEKKTRFNIEKLKALVLNNKDLFEANFAGYSQDQIPISNGFAQDKSDWTEANKLFSFNDNIYNKLSGVFSGDIKLSHFTVSGTFYFEFEFDNSNSITVDLSMGRNNLRIKYTNRNLEEGKAKLYSFEFKNLGSGFLSKL